MDQEQTISTLVANFNEHHESYCRSNSTYNETETRSDFINPFFEKLGWDMLNSQSLSRPLRQVISEANVVVDEATKKPDYEFRHNGIRKFFVEAKKPSVDILSNPDPALQLRRYGWSANLPISILTNFRQFSIYDCTVKPNDGDSAQVGLIVTINYEDYVEKIEDLEALISQQSVATGQFDLKFESLISNARGEQSFDDYFLDQIENWRHILAQDLYNNNPELSAKQLNYLVQMFLNRIVFLRICEDRNLEEYESLKQLPTESAVDQLMDLFREADAKYDSGLFDLLADTLTPTVVLSNEVLIGLVNDLYYPRSPYSFSVISPTILGSIYDRFISKTVEISDNQIHIETKPEVKQANGIYTTPPSVVKSIVTKSLELYEGDILSAAILDPAVGSGIFLAEAYDQLLLAHLTKCVDEQDTDKLRINDLGDYYLRLSTKRKILLEQIHGVDIDSQAVEAAMFSLHLKLLEDVFNGEIEEYLESGIKALPRLEENIRVGNSLVDSSSYLEFHGADSIEPDEYAQILPFDWQTEFQNIMTRGGFDIILANPPYTRIQNLVHYSANEAQFYQSTSSPYVSSRSNNFDKYQLFIERGYSLLNREGVLGYIVPHKFITNQAGQPLRNLIASNSALKELVHFGSIQLFPGQATTYSCLLFLGKNGTPIFKYEKVNSILDWQQARDEVQEYESSHLSGDPWIFATNNDGVIFNQIESSHTGKLHDIAEIFVGLQTSADKIFIRQAVSTENDMVTFTDVNGRSWQIEASITKPAILDLPGFDNINPIVPNRFMIFPYKQSVDEFVIIDENEMRNSFPRAFEYLQAFEHDLAARSMQGGGPWYRFGRAQSLNKFNTSKLIIKNPALKATVAYDEDNIMFTGGGNGPYYGVRPLHGTSIYFLHALLNSTLFDKWVKARSSEFRGGYFSYGKQFIQNFPIPNLNENSDLIDQIVRSWESLLHLPIGETPHDEARLMTQRNQIINNINASINSFYGLEPNIFTGDTSH